MQEILVGQGKDEVITLPRLEAIMQQALACGHMDQLNLPGLAQERKQVFPSGLAILIASVPGTEYQRHDLIRWGFARGRACTACYRSCNIRMYAPALCKA